MQYWPCVKMADLSIPNVQIFLFNSVPRHFLAPANAGDVVERPERNFVFLLIIMQAEIKRYIAELNMLYKAGNATEHSYRPALQNFLSVLVSSLQVTNEPKRIASGAPDFIVTRDAVSVGYIEA